MTAIPTYAISEATRSDTHAIATLFALCWSTPFTRLQFGNIPASALVASMAPRIEEQIEKAHGSFIVARHLESAEIVAVAQWTIPAPMKEEGKRKETKEEKEERRYFEEELFHKSLPESCNKELIMEFSTSINRMREEVLGEQPHFLLENLATHPNYRGQGLGSRLITSVFPKADQGGCVIYLETAIDNPAMQIYKRLGFEEKGSRTVENLSRYGGEGSHTHVAFIRYPNKDAG